MRRAEVRQGLREMKFEEFHDRFVRGRLSAAKASQLPSGRQVAM